MKSWLVIAGLLLSLVLVGSIACNPLGGEQKATEELAEVVRGDLTITVSGNGNIEVSDDKKLTFGIGGRIDKIFVEEGDKVSQGDVIARLDTDALELALTQAKLAYAQAQVAVPKAEAALAQTKVSIAQAEVTVTQAEINLKNAEIALEQTEKTSTLSDIKVAQTEVDTAKRDLKEALETLSKYESGTPGFEEYQKRVVQAQARLKTAEDRLDAMLFGSDTKEVAVKKQQVAAAEQSLEVARQSLESTRLSLEPARLAPEVAKQSLEFARLSMEQAQKQLDKATITAPFDGTIAKIYVEEGDTILASTRIAHLIVPDRMELKLDVDEIDVAQVEPGQNAIIEIDALPNLVLKGKVSYISLLPREEGGVIIFEVKIIFDVADGSGLRSGMSASADIITNERSNVLLVPNRALKQDAQGNTIVEVMVNDQRESRTVVTGITDGFQTEIINGLKEGEVVIEK